MKKKSLSILILDTDADSSARMSGAVTDIFNKVYVQNNFDQFERDCVGLKPDVLFMNLNIDQRDLSFHFLESLIKLNEHLPIVMGYADMVNSEFIAHAIENGISDIFARPFDPDIIASKVNRLIKSDETIDRELNYVRLPAPIKSIVDFNLKVKSVEENGFTLQSQHHISKGARLNISSDLMKEIFGTEQVQLIVTKTWFNEQGSEFLLFAEPKDQNEKSISGLRTFINTKV